MNIIKKILLTFIPICCSVNFLLAGSVEDSIRQTGNYSLLLELYEKSLSTNQSDSNYYKCAKYSSLVKDAKKTFAYLSKIDSINRFIDKILLDSDFYPLYKTNRWKDYKGKILDQYISSLDVSNEELSKKLYLIYLDDQRFRTFGYLMQPPYQDSITIMIGKKSHKKRLRIVKRIVRKNGWTTYSMVGKKSAFATFLVVQHSTKKRLYKKWIKYIKKNAEVGEASWEWYALLVDRLRVLQGRKQVYGTQLRRKVKIVDGEVIPDGELTVDPIEDEENVNERRKKIGLIPLEEYIKQFE